MRENIIYFEMSRLMEKLRGLMPQWSYFKNDSCLRILFADTVMLGYVSQTAMSASSLANQYTFILFCLYYGMATGTSVLCAQYWGKGDKKTVEKILGLAERISLISSLIFFIISFSMPTTIMRILQTVLIRLLPAVSIWGWFHFRLCLWDSLRFLWAPFEASEK